MRWLFLIVLSLNFAYVVWQLTLPSTASYADVRPLNNVQPIVLLSELNSKVAQQAASTPAADAKRAVVEAGPVKEEPVKAGPVKEEEAIAKLAVKDQAGAESQVTEAVKPDLTVQPDEPPRREACFTLGPFNELESLRAMTREIKRYVTATDFRGKEEKEQPIYWVYLRPEKNRSAAIATGESLKAKKIRDFYVIRDGEKKNGLSLGHFKNKAGAYGLAKKVKKLGFDVNVEPVIKTRTVYWLDYQLAPGTKIPESIFDKFAESGKKQAVSRLDRDCES